MHDDDERAERPTRIESPAWPTFVFIALHLPLGKNVFASGSCVPRSWRAKFVANCGLRFRKFYCRSASRRTNERSERARPTSIEYSTGMIRKFDQLRFRPQNGRLGPLGELRGAAFPVRLTHFSWKVRRWVRLMIRITHKILQFIVDSIH